MDIPKVAAMARPTLLRLSEEPQGGWLSMCYRYACDKMFPSEDFAADKKRYGDGAVFLLTLLIGLTGGIYGIGGGSILAPFLVSGFRLPVHVTAGPTLLCTLVTSTGGVLIYELIAPLYPGLSVGPDWTLGVLFGLGGLAGMYAGARCQKHLPERPVRLLLAVIVLGTALGWLLPLL